VLGAGSAAFDRAATALEAGAGQVDLFMRRAALPVVNALRVVESAAFFRHFAELPDDVRWRFMRRMTAASVPPPRDTVERASRHVNFNLRVATPWNSVTMTNAGIRIGTPRGVFEVDHVIAGTGFEVDLRLRPELTGIADHIALWSDRYTPPREEQDATLARYPYIGQCYQLLPRDPHAANWVSRIHLFNAGALVSTGSAAGGINSLPWRLPRLVNGITRDLFIAEADRIYEELASYDEPDPWEALSARAEAAP
jgi:cation diffusion facilitator CzcD-associated flavoprotein CzcO